MSFPKDFLWGAASAAYQVEGAYNEGGKGMGIWDALSEGHVKHGDNGNIACDHYHRFREDIALMKRLGLKCYRFSVSWPRVMPAPGVVNEEGLKFYSDLVDELLAAGIEPMCTVFHWNLPMWLHERGGWQNEETADAMADYAAILADRLSDRVKYWMTINEPACFIGLGYLTGAHAPFESCNHLPEDEQREKLTSLTRVTLLAHGKTVKALRAHARQEIHIGMALNGTIIVPENETPEEIAKARALTESAERGNFQVTWWADPMVLGKLPEALKGTISAADLAIIHQKLDFFGFNCYHAANYDGPIEPNPQYPGMPRTAMGWPITPSVLYWAARFFTDRYRLPFLVTENGMANIDFVMSDGKVHDPQRIDYLKGYIRGLQRAVEEGYPVIGYCQWSLMDNFEWAEGYEKRFGMIHIDYVTQKRTLKDSALWYAEVIKANGIFD